MLDGALDCILRFSVAGDPLWITDMSDRFRSIKPIRLTADNGSIAWELLEIQDSPVPPKRSQQAMQQVRAWLGDCLTSHTKCNIPLSRDMVEYEADLPSRLIQVECDEQLGPRLVDTKGGRGQYLTLSHCWGGKTPIMTTISNIESCKRVIPFSSLAPTFRDAIELTRCLNVPYLWIDSLCIVQDDPEDWLREAREMGSIYAKSLLTITATSSPDSYVGLYGADTRPTYIKVPCGPDHPKSGHMYPSHPPDCGREDEIASTPLNQRGWVLQERLLSRRLPHFTSSRVYWECEQSRDLLRSRPECGRSCGKSSILPKPGLRLVSFQLLRICYAQS